MAAASSAAANQQSLLSDHIIYLFVNNTTHKILTGVSHIQISNTLVSYCWRVVKPFIAVLVLYSSGCSSAMGSALYWVSVDVHESRYGWSMRQASAMLLVPDIPLTDKKQ